VDGRDLRRESDGYASRAVLQLPPVVQGSYSQSSADPGRAVQLQVLGEEINEVSSLAMAVVTPESPASRVEQEVLRLRGLVEARQFAQCEAAACSLLAEVPENRDILYLLAVSQRYSGRIADALRTLEQF